ncbi:MAG: hypothetical protein Q4F95_07260 [Oscillospiraceae bacterium]|nr:hypothetical protein [Oscillospiraceae bacterium]
MKPNTNKQFYLDEIKKYEVETLGLENGEYRIKMMEKYDCISLEEMTEEDCFEAYKDMLADKWMGAQLTQLKKQREVFRRTLDEIVKRG